MPNDLNIPKITEMQEYSYGDKLTMVLTGNNPSTGDANVFGHIDAGIDTANGEITQVQGKQDEAYARMGTIKNDTGRIVTALGQANGSLDTIVENLMIKAGQGINVSADRTISLTDAVYAVVQSMPALEFGTSNSLTVPGNSNVTGEITFAAPKTEAPLIFCSIQGMADLHCVVEQVTNQQFAFRVYNAGNADAEAVTLDWLAVSGR